MQVASPYPEAPSERSAWIMARRPARAHVDPLQAEAFVETERGPCGTQIPTATLFLTNRECPWRCVMCDLWKHTTIQSLPAGAIPVQIAEALRKLPGARQVKLYNAGSFFDPAAIPPEDYPAIAALVRGFERVIVECHPSLAGPRALQFQKLIEPARLEIAIGLETIHEPTLALLNKRMTVGDYERAARFLGEAGISLRTFLLLPPPFLPKEQGLGWTVRSVQFAFDRGSAVVSLIPLRTSNGAMEELRSAGLATEPTLADIERTFAESLSPPAGRLFLDLWDLERFSRCPVCFENRRQRLRAMNAQQTILDPVCCRYCPSES